MPIYEYECANCGAVQEIIVKRGAAQMLKCSKCGGHNLTKQLSAFAVGTSRSSDTFCEKYPEHCTKCPSRDAPCPIPE